MEAIGIGMAMPVGFSAAAGFTHLVDVMPFLSVLFSGIRFLMNA
jgi:hypothetical protein